ncbi:hypothetical protein [Rhodanobacter glycinis]|uniref:hypothetical protein n=1 Tax=Rhodanobacter glycinis TaxID=582702 RepID=UPI001113F53C|nr:hypothetical protein [Rhodanobacter glycinis]
MDNEQPDADRMAKFAQVGQKQARQLAFAPYSANARHGAWFTICGLALGAAIALLAGLGMFIGAACGAMVGSYTSWLFLWLRKKSHAA